MAQLYISCTFKNKNPGFKRKTGVENLNYIRLQLLYHDIFKPNIIAMIL